MPTTDIQQLYHNSIVIDGLNVSNWDSPAVFENLRAGNISAISATVATWENFLETMDHLTAWMQRFRQRQDIMQVHSVADIHAAKKADKTGIILSFQQRLTHRKQTRSLCPLPRPGRARHSAHLPRAQPAGQRLL